jgi:hypothetical protein
VVKLSLARSESAEYDRHGSCELVALLEVKVLISRVRVVGDAIYASKQVVSLWESSREQAHERDCATHATVDGLFAVNTFA